MPKRKSDRRWRVAYNLIYEGGGSCEWDGYYRTLMSALISRFYNRYIGSWGGTALLIDQNKYRAPIFRFDP